MGKKKRDTDDADQIEYLRRGLRSAKNKGDYKEVASIHNQLGNIYRIRGDYEDAIEEHKLEGKVTKEHFPNDKISLAIAYRCIGEVYIDSKEEKKAIPYVEKYLKLATKADNIVEEQRAHITLGRIHLGLIEKDSDNEGNGPPTQNKRNQAIENAKRQFTRAKELAETTRMKLDLKEKDLAEMKCVTYLNLGISYDLDDKLQEATEWFDKAIAIARRHGFCDTICRCFSCLYTTQMRQEKYNEAYKTAQDLFGTAKQLDNKTQAFEARILEAKALFMLNEMEKGVNILKRTRKLIKKNESALELLEELDPMLTAAVRVMRADDEVYATESHDVEKLKSLFEIKGDNYFALGNLQEAIKNYHKSILAAEKSGLRGKPLAALYYSLAETYKDYGNYSNALKYYRKEMEINAGNKIEEFKTQTNIADCLEKAHESKEIIIEAYLEAIKLAKGFPSKEIIGLKNLAQHYKSNGDEIEAEIYFDRAESIKKSNSEPEDDSQELLLDGDVDEIDLDDLSSAESESEEEEERDAPKNMGIARKPFKTRKNEKGETQLHIAAQKGDVKSVRRLLAQGHEVNPMDYSGWIPLHEACNFGHYEVVVELLKHKADVNNSGGNNSVSNGITPIHDAANNGHIAVMRALLKYGASPVVRDKEGNRPLDSLVGWYERERKAGDLPQEKIQEYEEMKEYLINAMKKVGKIYTKKDELAARRKANRRTPSPEFSVMKTGSIDEPVPVKICVAVDPDENEGRAGVDEYNEAMSMLRRKDVSASSSSSRQSRSSRKQKGSSTPKKALLEESKVVDEWMVPDEDLAPDTSNKRKRDPFDDLRQADRNIRRRKDGMRNSVAQMDLRSTSPLPSFAGPSSSSTRVIQDSPDDEDDIHITVPLDEPTFNSNHNLLDKDEDEETQNHSGRSNNNSPVFNSSSSNKNEPETLIISDNDSDEDTNNFRRRSSSNSFNDSQDDSLFRASSRPKQTKLPFKRVIRPPVNITSPPSPPPRISRTPSFNLDRSTPQEFKPLRLKIEILDTKILVPVSSLQADESIEWLCNEVAERYYKESELGMKPTVTLKTKDGALLSRTDKIRDAISENDIELIAKVEDCTVVALNKRFEAACKKINIEPNIEIIRSLTRSETTEVLTLTDTCLRGKIHDALFNTLQHNCCLRELNVSGCSLRDDGIKKLCSTLSTLTQLENLNLSCNGMTHETLGRLVDAFTKSPSPGKPYRPPLGLKKLILNYNPLGNSITGPLCQIIQRLQQLQLVSVVDCNLTAGFFSKNKKDFINVINSSTIETLDISYNHFGKGGLQLLTTELNSNPRLRILTKCCE